MGMGNHQTDQTKHHSMQVMHLKKLHNATDMKKVKNVPAARTFEETLDSRSCWSPGW